MILATINESLRTNTYGVFRTKQMFTPLSRSLLKFSTTTTEYFVNPTRKRISIFDKNVQYADTETVFFHC